MSRSNTKEVKKTNEFSESDGCTPGANRGQGGGIFSILVFRHLTNARFLPFFTQRARDFLSKIYKVGGVSRPTDNVEQGCVRPSKVRRTKFFFGTGRSFSTEASFRSAADASTAIF